MNEGTDIVTLRERILSGAAAFLEATRNGEDIAHPAIAERADALGDRPARMGWDRR